MKRALITAILLSLPGTALAQNVTGTINLTGSIAGRCSVAGGGQVFTDTINLGELAGGDGQLRTDLADATADAVRAFSVICTGATPKVTLSATRLATGGTAPTGYANAIDYTSNVAVTQASGTPPAIIYRTATALPPATVVTLTGPLANATENVVVSVHSFATDAGALLVAGGYTAVINVTISPS
jgi:hypothetical protein